MKRFALVLAALLVGTAAMAMPTDQEIEKVTPVIGELTRDDFAALKSGKMTRAQLAEALLGYLADAESEAAKLVLIREAFRQRMLSGDTAKAVEAYALLGTHVENVPNGTFGTWCAPFVATLAKADKANDFAMLLEHAFDAGDAESASAIYKQLQPVLRRLVAAKTGGPRLSVVIKRFASLERRKAEARELRAALRGSPNDVALHEKYGLCLVAMGDWKAALKEFAQTGSKLADVAVWENTQPEAGTSPLTAADVAEFWWEKAEAAAKDVELASALRNHAAGWYRVAVDDGELSGLKKTLAEKRIAEVGKTGEVAAVGGGTDAADAGKLITIPMDNGVEMVLMPCPAGTFTMGYEGGDDVFKPHEVTISRPFWMAKFLVTREQWNSLMPPKPMGEIEKALGGDKAAISDVFRDEVEEFCASMTKKYRRFLPPNYIFRLPTEAEWEYAARANAGPDDPYGKPNGLSAEEGKSIAMYCNLKADILRQANVAFDEKKVWALPGTTVGLKKPNQWGLFDMIGNLNEMTYDLPPRGPDGKLHVGGSRHEIEYVDATDPLLWTTSDGPPRPMVRESDRSGSGWGFAKRVIHKSTPYIGFRIVIGPDLVKERKLKPLGK